MLSWIISIYLCGFIVIAFLLTSERFLHWFIMPVFLCGVLIGVDAIKWIRGRLDIFDPLGIIGAIGFHFFFLAPLLHVYWDIWLRWVVPPTDWRPWLGGMAILNFFGLCLYRVCRQLNQPHSTESRLSLAVWRINKRKMLTVLAVALLVSGVAEGAVLYRYGGISGYIATFEEGRHAFTGMGWLFAISESFPIWLMIAYAIYAKDKKFLSRWPALILWLGIFLTLQFFVGGLRGSRSNTIWAVFWALGVIHFFIRRIPKAMVLIGLGLLVGFMYIYGFYKAFGIEGVTLLPEASNRRILEERSGRSLQTLILGDLARADVQAFLLYRFMETGSKQEYAWGRTYLGAAALLIPRTVWPDRPPTKVKEGTEVLYGTYIPEVQVASKVYGLAGETMLNFGPLAVPFAFIPLGILVARVRRILLTLRNDDARWFIVPLFVNLCFVSLIGDSDNILVFLITKVALPFLVIYLGSDRATARSVHI